MFYKIIRETYVDLIYLIVGITAIFILVDQIQILGLDVFNPANIRPYRQARFESNLLNLCIFLVIAVLGTFFGISGLLETLKREYQEKQKNNIYLGIPRDTLYKSRKDNEEHH